MPRQQHDSCFQRGPKHHLPTSACAPAGEVLPLSIFPSWRVLLLCCLFLLLAACGQQEEAVEYQPPKATGTAYVLGEDTDHLAVLDLATTRLTRLSLDRALVDLAIRQGRLLGLAPDGALVAIDRQTGATSVIAQPLTSGVAMSPGGAANELWLLGAKEICRYRLGQGIDQRYPLPAPATSLFFDQQKKRLVLIDRASGKLAVFDPASLKVEAAFPFAGNSVHHGAQFPPNGEYWIAEGNEYMNGEPYGVGYAKDKPAMPGGVNVIDPATGKQTDFLMLGGNVVDIAFSPDSSKAYVAISQLPAYIEATLSLLDTASRRVRAEFRLCDACHIEEGVEPGRERLLLRALALDWSGGQPAKEGQP